MSVYADERNARIACREIEAEHRELFRRIEAIKSAIEAGDMDFLVPALEDFQGQVKEHFLHEEAIMRLYGYPYYDDHKLLHRDLFEALEVDIGRQPVGESAEVSLRLLNHLTEELRHCVAEDRHLTAYLRNL